MAMPKYGHAVLATKIVAPEKWVDKQVAPQRVKVAKQVLADYDASKWLLSHATIIASVDVDIVDPNDKKSNYLIKPEYSIFVNNNGDSWERELLKSCYQSFVGSDNYVEHVQIPELSKGKIIDVALREVPFTKDMNGKDLTTLYVDILVATNKKHADLVNKIKTGEYNAMSMGCLIEYSQCSQCGNIAKDETESCNHIKYFKNNYFFDPNGVKRIVAELCGRVEDPKSCRFIEASWVRKPAFEGAVLRNILEPIGELSENQQRAFLVPSLKVEPGMLLRAASIAEQLAKSVEGQEGDEPKDEAPKSDIDFPEAPAEAEGPLDAAPEGEEAPEGEALPEEESAPAPAGIGTPEGEPEQLAAPVPQEDATVNEVKDMLKQHVLNEIRNELVKKVGPNVERPPFGAETATNESLSKDASFSVLKNAKVRWLIRKAQIEKNKKLVNGLLILSNIKEWPEFKKYGYSRNDVIGLMHYIDLYTSENPVGQDLVKIVSSIKTGSNLKEFFTDIIIESGRKPTANEAKKLASWRNILIKL